MSVYYSYLHRTVVYIMTLTRIKEPEVKLLNILGSRLLEMFRYANYIPI